MVNEEEDASSRGVGRRIMGAVILDLLLLTRPAELLQSNG